MNSAIANDVGFENLFLSQIQSQYKKGDILIVMSVSRIQIILLRPPNGLKKKRGKVFGILGFNGGKLKKNL